MKCFALIITTAFLFGCLGIEEKTEVHGTPTKEDRLGDLINLMTGSFNSSEQAASDSDYYDISLTMHPIWADNSNGSWLYVEQAVSSDLKSPYRQRVYHVTQINDSTFSSAVLELSNPSNFVHAWENDSLFSTITPDSLISREGCAVILYYKGQENYAGATNEQDCLSDFRGASYATSIVEIDPSKITSWDQGWDAEGNQVWGAEKGGYVFNRQ